MTSQETVDKLVEHGINPSAQRIAILQHLFEHHTHPTIEDVYNDLHPELPTLSRTTVYNTLRMFSEHDVAQMITIDEHHVCYDGDMTPHSHFICTKCGKVLDIFDDPNNPQLTNVHLGEGFKVRDVKLYYKGLCPKCSVSTVD